MKMIMESVMKVGHESTVVKANAESYIPSQTKNQTSSVFERVG